MIVQKIPLLAQTSDQVLSIDLGGNPYILRVVWNERFGYFSLSVSESDETPILINVKMVKNYPLTAKFKDTRLPFGGLFFIQEKGNSENPTYDDLAVNCNLYYIEPDATTKTSTIIIDTTEFKFRTEWDDGQTIWDDGLTVWD